ncbi:UNKNOWN [Stylonychia lemnae]|uniref:Uncharacterized protein n=1 Tax=Stylonychia lemnae TaxID=5949 RepID=A0A078BAD1_STYLE|nr:UNKNOWN [Stylonychia lemnae]|eukprot:CDW91515.1 UNKNOWN [Stylonychia lemnae]
MDKIQQKTQALNKYAKRIPKLDMISEKTKLEPGLILAIILALTLLIFLVLFGVQLATLYITILYPGYNTLQALERKKNETDWLIYWTLFGIFSLLEELLCFVFNMIPLYCIVRLVFFVYLWLPKTQGALVIYEMVVSPLFAENRAKLRVQIQKSQSLKPNVSVEDKETFDPYTKSNTLKDSQVQEGKIDEQTVIKDDYIQQSESNTDDGSNAYAKPF